MVELSNLKKEVEKLKREIREKEEKIKLNAEIESLKKQLKQNPDVIKRREFLTKAARIARKGTKGTWKFLENVAAAREKMERPKRQKRRR